MVPISLSCMYRIQKEAEFLFTHLKPNSLVVISTLKRKRVQSASHMEGKKLDTRGKCFYSAGMLCIKAMNYIDCMTHYNYTIWEGISEALANLLEDKKLKLQKAQEKGMLDTKQILNLAKNVCDTFAKTLLLAVDFLRQAWLRSTLLHPDARAYVEDLPFDREGLFHMATADVLQEMEKSLMASRNLSISSS